MGIAKGRLPAHRGEWVDLIALLRFEAESPLRLDLETLVRRIVVDLVAEALLLRERLVWFSVRPERVVCVRLHGLQLQGNSNFRIEPVGVSCREVESSTWGTLRRSWTALVHKNGKLGAVIREEERTHLVST